MRACAPPALEFIKRINQAPDWGVSKFNVQTGEKEKSKSPIEDVFGDVEEITDIPSGKWEGEPPSENQLNAFNGALARATDDGKTDLVKKAKDFLHSGKANKKNLFDWIDTDADPWTLVDGS